MSDTLIEQIRVKVMADEFEFTRHALDQSILRRIAVKDVREAIQNAELIENYPDDKYGPSCLVLGFTNNGRLLHVHFSYPSRPILKVITLYQPDPALWIDNKVRRE
jgi:hypothetical protein